MPDLHLIVQTLSLSLAGTRNTWLDSGMNISPGEGLAVTSSGAIRFHGSQTAFPEGIYADSANPHALDLSAVRSYSDIGLGESRFAIPQVRPYSLAMLLLPVGQTPVVDVSDTSGAIQVNRSWIGDPLASSYFGGAPKLRAWFLLNETHNDWKDNSGSFDITLERYADSPQSLPAVRGGRTVPPALLTHLRAQTQHPAWCWVVKPVHGPWEFYTTLDVPLTLPAYNSVKGEASVPAATYKTGFGVDLTTIPVTLKVETSGTDVTVLYFERAKLLGGYYFGAQIEVFEVDWTDISAGRWVAFSGLFGNAVVGDIGATLELSTWDVALESARALTVTYSCPYKFCEGMCRNPDANDGPVDTDWTRAGTVTGVSAATYLRVQMSGGFVTNGARETGFYSPSDRLAAWAARLNEGRLTMSGSASNAGFAVEVKLSHVVGTDLFDLELRGSFPLPPNVGDSVLLRSGCAKSPDACKSYRNAVNCGGFWFLPLAEGMRRI